LEVELGTGDHGEQVLLGTTDGVGAQDRQCGGTVIGAGVEVRRPEPGGHDAGHSALPNPARAV
jgi:hypothetical protein